MSAAIRIDALTKDYAVGFWRKRPYRALDGLTLEIAPGEVFGFLGPNGAGKTTTLKLLMQLIYPTSGRAEILGRPVGDVSTRHRIGFLPENPYFYDNLTAEELLHYFGELFGQSAADRRARIPALLDRVGLGAERRLRLRKFSKGMVQRVGIAQALLNDPEVIFLDEPMSGLDPLGRRDVRSLILSLRDQGRTIFFSSHILSDAESLCSRVGIVAGGRLAAMGRLTELLDAGTRGWELVAANVSPDLASRLTSRAARTIEIAPGRYTYELPADAAPERLLADLAAGGAQLVSLNPVRATLEDLFVRHVTATGAGARAAFGATDDTEGKAGGARSKESRARH
jgi:ABC-2 type transport system ATP-binding protein